MTFELFKSKKPGDNLLKDALQAKTEAEKTATQKKIDTFAFSEALVEAMSNFSEEELDELERIAQEEGGEEKVKAILKEKVPNFREGFEGKRDDIKNSLETSLEDADGVDIDLAEKLGGLAFRAALTEALAQREDADAEEINAIMESNKSAEEKMKLLSEKLPELDALIEEKTNKVSSDVSSIMDIAKKKLDEMRSKQGE